jgi:two-component system, sensor histidine kinase and response regulator
MSNNQKKVHRILIVDDNVKNLQVIGKTLRDEQYEIEFAMEGNSALEWIFKKDFDLVLLDINMPGMSGFEVCQKIRSDSRFNKMPIIFLTADSNRESNIKGFELGAQDYITKPNDTNELIMRVKTHVTLKESLEELEELNNTLIEKVYERTIELEKAKEKVEENNRLKSAFINNLSHELRTPMNGLLGFLELIKKPALEDKDKERYIEMVTLSSQRLLNTINDLIEVSKIEAGENAIIITEFDLEEVMQLIYDYFKFNAKEKKLKFILNQQIKGETAFIKSDKVKIFIILTNLLSNAIKFTHTGVIELGNYFEDEDLILFVKDTGIGISQEQLKIIFDRFVQADHSPIRSYEGLGLGLSIVKAHVDSLKGQIKVDSKPGKGTSFYIKLPHPTVQ